MRTKPVAFGRSVGRRRHGGFATESGCRSYEGPARRHGGGPTSRGAAGCRRTPTGGWPSRRAYLTGWACQAVAASMNTAGCS